MWYELDPDKRRRRLPLLPDPPLALAAFVIVVVFRAVSRRGGGGQGECLVAFKTMRGAVQKWRYGYLQKFISHTFDADVIGW